MKKIVVFLFVLFVACDKSSDSGDKNESLEGSGYFNGEWSGVVEDNSFYMDIDLDGESRGVNKTYDCYVDFFVYYESADTVSFRVNLQSGPCVDNAVVELVRKTASQVGFKLFYTESAYLARLATFSGELKRK